MEGARRHPTTEGVRHQENLNAKNIPVNETIAREQSKQMATAKTATDHGYPFTTDDKYNPENLIASNQ